jgi:hypothetical protein
VGFGLIHNGHVPVTLECFQVQSNQVAQFVYGVVRHIDLFSELGKHLGGLIFKKLHQDIVFVFEIQVNRSVGDTRFTGNLGNR